MGAVTLQGPLRELLLAEMTGRLGPESLQGKPGLTDRRLVWKEAWIPGLPHAQAHTHMCVQSTHAYAHIYLHTYPRVQRLTLVQATCAHIHPLTPTHAYTHTLLGPGHWS